MDNCLRYRIDIIRYKPGMGRFFYLPSEIYQSMLQMSIKTL